MTLIAKKKKKKILILDVNKFLEYLPPRYDSVFKALFGDKNHKEFILSFLKSFLDVQAMS